MDQAKALRPYNGVARARPFSERLQVTRTHLPLDEEYWLALRPVAEIEAYGMVRLATGNAAFLGFSREVQAQLWRELRAYIRQAEGFYRGACVLPWKSSPLNYYYSFMNLVKALAVVRVLLPPTGGGEPRRLAHAF